MYVICIATIKQKRCESKDLAPRARINTFAFRSEAHQSVSMGLDLVMRFRTLTCVSLVVYPELGPSIAQHRRPDRHRSRHSHGTQVVPRMQAVHPRAGPQHSSPDCRACRNELSSLRHMAKKPLEKGFVSLLVKSPKASV